VSISRFFLAAGLSLFPSLLWAQTPSIQPPQIIISGGTVVAKIDTPISNARLQLRDGTASVSEKSVKGNTSEAQITLQQAEPGAYTLQFTQNDKLRTPIGTGTPIVVPGVRREYGNWLFNGSLLIPVADESTFVAAPPKFLPNLKRDAKTKLPQSTNTTVLQEWATIPLDGEDFKAKGANYVLPSLPQKTPKSGYWVGYELHKAYGLSTEDIKRLRAIIEAQSAGAALILSVNAYDLNSISAITLNQLASSCDAVKIDTTKDSPTALSFSRQLWVLKVARRIAEERENYDLPIFVSQFDQFGTFSPSQALELFQSGATGIVVRPDQAADLNSIESLWRRNTNWLSGSVTLEDAAILPDAGNTSLVFLDKLRNASRIPLLGRTPSFEKSRPESVLAVIDENTAESTLKGLKTSAEAGQTIYVEGLPAQTLWKYWGDTTKTELTALNNPKEEQLRLNDLWLFGAHNGAEFRVKQHAKIVLKADLAAQANEKPGEARETKTRAIGNLTGDENGMLMCPVGKGRILWAPHSWQTGSAPKAPFYAAITGAMQPALVNLTLANGQSIEGKNLRMAVRMSQGKTILFSVFNEGRASVDLTAKIRDEANLVWDLKSEKQIPATVRGYGTTLQFTVPAGDFAYFALYDSKQTFEKERKTPRLKAKIK
jgi:hypothetical protein